MDEQFLNTSPDSGVKRCPACGSVTAKSGDNNLDDDPMVCVVWDVGDIGARTKHLLDIWKLYGECLRDERFRWHKRKFKHVWGWGEEAASGLTYRNGTLAVTP